MITKRRILSSIRSAARFCCPLLVIVAAFPAQAQDWQFNPEIAAGYEFDDNARLSTRTDDVISLNGLLVEANADILYESAVTNFLLTPRILDRSYPGDPDFDSTEIDVRADYRLDMLKDVFRIDFRLNRDAVRNAERADDDIDNTDPDDIPDDDTAIVQISGNRDRLSFRPSWTHSWSDTSSTRLQLDYRDVRYDDVLIFLVDYTDAALTGDYRLDFSQNTAGFISGSARRYESADDINNFDTWGVNFGLETRLTPTLRMRVRLGAEDVEATETSRSETQPVGEVTFIQRLETIKLLAQYRRSVSAGGGGRMATRDAINLNFTRELTERFDAGLGVRAYSNEPIDLGGTGANTFRRDYLQLTARFTWNITRTFAFRTSYRYTVLNREFVGESANSNQIFAWIIFQPKGAVDDR